MSIATSVLVQPSRTLLIATLSLSLGITFAAVMIGLGHVSELSVWWRVSVASCCFVLAITGFIWAIQQRKTFRLDISANGKIWLMEHNGLTAPAESKPEGAAGNQLMQLMPDSILWPDLLLLRLQAENGRKAALTILRDSTSQQSFRALSVACRWIAAQNNRAIGTIV